MADYCVEHPLVEFLDDLTLTVSVVPEAGALCFQSRLLINRQIGADFAPFPLYATTKKQTPREDKKGQRHREL